MASIGITEHSVVPDTKWSKQKEVTILCFLDLAVVSSSARTQMACYCADGFLAGRLCCSNTTG